MIICICDNFILRMGGVCVHVCVIVCVHVYVCTTCVCMCIYVCVFSGFRLLWRSERLCKLHIPWTLPGSLRAKVKTDTTTDLKYLFRVHAIHIKGGEVQTYLHKEFTRRDRKTVPHPAPQVWWSSIELRPWYIYSWIYIYMHYVRIKLSGWLLVFWAPVWFLTGNPEAKGVCDFALCVHK